MPVTRTAQSLTDEELRNELLTLVLAGHETTANTIAWAFERLLRHPDSYDRLRDAVRSDDAGRTTSTRRSMRRCASGRSSR